MDSKQPPEAGDEDGERKPTHSSSRKQPRSSSSSGSDELKNPVKKADGLGFDRDQKKASAAANKSIRKQPPPTKSRKSFTPDPKESIDGQSRTSRKPSLLDKSKNEKNVVRSVPIITNALHSSPTKSIPVAGDKRLVARLDGISRPITPADSTTPSTNLPSAIDVLFGRGRQNRDHPGNRWMQLIVDIHGDAYYKADRDRKTAITTKIVQIIKKQSSRFLKFDKKQNKWKEVSDEAARDKVGHAMRDGRARPMESSLDLTLFDGLFTIPRELREAVERMISLKQNDAHATFGVEEANILSDLLASSSSQSSPDGTDASGESKPAAEGSNDGAAL